MMCHFSRKNLNINEDQSWNFSHEKQTILCISKWNYTINTQTFPKKRVMANTEHFD